MQETTMRKAIAMVFAGGRGEDLSVLTERRPKSAVIFGGIYRCIDFALTNLARAGIGQVGILAQYRPASLMDHVGTGMAWDLVGASRGVRFLPPYLKLSVSEWYRGPADALYQNLDFVERADASDVVVVSADHVYSMDYAPLLNFHHERDADLTMVFAPRDADAGRFGIGELNATGQIINFIEKPEFPRTNLASMSVYVFKKEVLVEELRRAVSGEDQTVTFQIHEVLRRMISRRRAYGFIFRGAWSYSRTLDEYYAFHQDVLGAAPTVDIAAWDVQSNLMAGRASPPPPARCLPGARIVNSLVSAGCVIEGTVENSVLSPGVRVGPRAVVQGSVLWNDVVVEADAHVCAAIADKRVVFAAGCQVGVGESVASEERPTSLSCGASVLAMNVRLPAGARVGKNCLIHVEATPDDIGLQVLSGKSVWPAATGRPVRP
jgi:glucose-1-phosphate adenylyltransferase